MIPARCLGDLDLQLTYFSAYDVFHLTRFEEPVKCIAGLVAGLIR